MNPPDAPEHVPKRSQAKAGLWVGFVGVALGVLMTGKVVSVTIVSLSTIPAGADIRPMGAAFVLVVVMVGIAGIEFAFGIFCLAMGWRRVSCWGLAGLCVLLGVLPWVLMGKVIRYYLDLLDVTLGS